MSGRTRLDFGDEQARHISGKVAGRRDAVLADAACRDAAAVRAHRLFAAGLPLNPPPALAGLIQTETSNSMTYQNYSLKQLQAIDAAHHLHPFTDHKELRDAGTRMIVRADGPFIYDTEGNELLDGMAGLWCVNVGYGRDELAEAAYDADEGAALLQLLLPLLDADAGAARAEDSPRSRPKTSTRCSSARRARKPTTRRCGWCATTGRSKASRRRTASSRASMAYHGSTIAGASLGGMDRHARAAWRRGAQHRPCHDALCLRARAARRERP